MCFFIPLGYFYAFIISQYAFECLSFVQMPLVSPLVIVLFEQLWSIHPTILIYFLSIILTNEVLASWEIKENSRETLSVYPSYVHIETYGCNSTPLYDEMTIKNQNGCVHKSSWGNSQICHPPTKTFDFSSESPSTHQLPGSQYWLMFTLSGYGVFHKLLHLVARASLYLHVSHKWSPLFNPCIWCSDLFTWVSGWIVWRVQ